MRRKRALAVVMMVLCIGFLYVPQAAIGGNPPPTAPTIGGPEYWGVVVINCNANTITLRVKRVVDCNVETQALVESYGSAICLLPELTESDLLNQWVHGTVFGESGVPIVTKVKNLKKEELANPPFDYTGTVYSADVQIRFCTNCN